MRKKKPFFLGSVATYGQCYAGEAPAAPLGKFLLAMLPTGGRALLRKN
jgi:hypothetical protein